ncbi:diguanylate cyclase domain-containing protein [Oscillibacter sp.]|uniref:GGDEF domain-containing protein n=1 Tax=Oscillibacter sp. TaxID=1945593 RepID=UPI0028ADAB8F|nr:diguanylate cyclase [Oscillibacter sp.]
MSALSYVELNVFSLVFLILCYVNIHNKDKKYLYDQKIFLLMLEANAVLLILDSLQWILNGKPGAALRVVSIIIAVVYSAMTPVSCFLWSVYADYQINRDESHIKKLFIPLAIPLFINLVLALLSALFGFLFVIDQNNIYSRGPLFYLMASICYFYLFYSLIYIINKRKSVEYKAYIPLLLFALPPFIGGIIQSLFYGISIVWNCTTISIFIIFINIQNSQLYTDSLTGLYNRRQFDNYMQECFRSCDKGVMLGIIMSDLDSFKKINDLWGHIAGDAALVEAGRILKNSFRKEDIICRYGGDEFVVVVKVDGKVELSNMVERLKTNVKKFNQNSGLPYSINFSVGFDILNCKSSMTIQQFIKHIDNLMYEDKSRNKSDKLQHEYHNTIQTNV